MKRLAYLLVVPTMLVSLSAWGQGNIGGSLQFSSEQAREVFCRSRDNTAHIKRRFFDPNQRLSFDNGEFGIGGKGVCWWHSRFQRNALYLANFDSSAPRPSAREAKRIINQIRGGNQIVNIPGFSNLREFSAAFEGEIVKELENWQLVDGFIKQRWIQGIRGSARSAGDLREQMEEMYERVVEKGQITYAKLQLPGMTAHAMLVGSMERTEDGYSLEVIDSNDAGNVQTYHYRNGEDSLTMQPGIVAEVDAFVPYVEFTDEVEKLEKVLAGACGSFEVAEDSADCLSGDTLTGYAYTNTFIFDPDRYGFAQPRLGQDMTYAGAAADCSSRPDGDKEDDFEMPSAGGAPEASAHQR